MRTSRWLTVSLAAAGLFAGGLALAESLGDFEKAQQAMSNGEGCESIPYYSLRSTCVSQQALVHPWCDGDRGPVSCDKGVTAKLNTQLTQLARTEDALERELDGLKRELASADGSERSSLQRGVDQKQRELDDTREEIARREGELKAHRDEVSAAITTLNKCLDARRAVMNVFAAAKDKVVGERDPEIVPIARELRDAYEESKRGHELAITGKENALAVCEAEAR